MSVVVSWLFPRCIEPHVLTIRLLQNRQKYFITSSSNGFWDSSSLFWRPCAWTCVGVGVGVRCLCASVGGCFVAELRDRRHGLAYIGYRFDILSTYS